MSSWWSQCPWGKPRPYEWLPQPFTIHPGGGGGWWRDTQVPPYGRLSFPCAIHPAWAVGCGGVGRTESCAPTQGLRYRLPFNPAGRASPPHPSASLTPSPPGEGRAVICFHLPFDREGRWALPCWRDTQVPPYGQLSFPFAIQPYTAMARAGPGRFMNRPYGIPGCLFLSQQKTALSGGFFLGFMGLYSALSAFASAAALAAAAFFSAAAFWAALNFSFSSGVGMGSMALRGQALAHMVQFLHLL